jgi:DNA invertase Pin-like site-specific DNA recombinase
MYKLYCSCSNFIVRRHQARAKGTTFGRPKSAAKKTAEIKRLYRKEKLSKSEIARRLGIGRTSVRRLLESA